MPSCRRLPLPEPRVQHILPSGGERSPDLPGAPGVPAHRQPSLKPVPWSPLHFWETPPDTPSALALALGLPEGHVWVTGHQGFLQSRTTQSEVHHCENRLLGPPEMSQIQPNSRSFS